jgi:hypothetical protein
LFFGDKLARSRFFESAGAAFSLASGSGLTLVLGSGDLALLLDAPFSSASSTSSSFSVFLAAGFVLKESFDCCFAAGFEPFGFPKNFLTLDLANDFHMKYTIHS